MLNNVGSEIISVIRSCWIFLVNLSIFNSLVILKICMMCRRLGLIIVFLMLILLSIIFVKYEKFIFMILGFNR